MSKSLIIFQVDAFTNQLFEGNPAGVVILDQDWPKANVLIKIAREINLSETAFIKPLATNSYQIRFFTPTCEVPLCGHASLSAAHIIFNELAVNLDSVELKTTETSLFVTRLKTYQYAMQFPLYTLTEINETQQAKASLGIEIAEVYSSNYNWKLLICHSEKELKQLNPSVLDLVKSGFGQSIISCKSEDPFDFAYRCFVPDLGILEDPVTGSAQCALVPYWSKKLGKLELSSTQLSGRNNRLKAQYLNQSSINVIGEAKTVIKGNLYISD